MLSLLALAALLLPVSSAPTRTNCRCTILDTSTSKSWTSSIPASNSGLSPSASEYNVCANLGPQLENFRHSQPDLYQSYIQRASLENSQPTPTPTADQLQQPLTTTVLLRLAAQNGFESLGVVLPSAPTERPTEIIVCHPEPETFTIYQDSKTTLFALNVIVAMVILACVAESIILVSDWLQRRKSTTTPTHHHHHHNTLRLTGAERLLRAPTRADLECIFSPGAEKKMRAYEAPGWVERTTPSEKPEFFTAYLVTIEEEDDDDEMNRPVM
ncbi:hypothetical protein K504DRAFT_538405 [Pleomassaria siparia CBS 279.74]|uniref:Uncharacterized protein n=1 Tax=Pleomassaria siparia CBS 279.74 TaxID=1314801 RepID=A0A6G1JTJ7_9PLEO|nr:hypothetical protein K504DRAFT_538405 [Pleomassaria siparia CBS 279.74]